MGGEATRGKRESGPMSLTGDIVRIRTFCFARTKLSRTRNFLTHNGYRDFALHNYAAGRHASP